MKAHASAIIEVIGLALAIAFVNWICGFSNPPKAEAIGFALAFRLLVQHYKKGGDV